MSDREPALAVLVDYENMARPGAKGRDDFAIDLVLNRLADKGRVLVKRAYADWSRYRDARHSLINAGLELIEMPSAREGAKNRADIKMAVDAMELVYSRVHLDNFVLVSGDSDFTPLVGKLRELNKRVIGVGNRESASDLLIANCDEFIFYDKISASGVKRRGGKFDPIELLKETLASLQREGSDHALASVVKDSMRRKAPAFDESDLGFATFTRFLEDAGEKGIVRLVKDPKSGTYQVYLSEDHRPAKSDGDKPRSEGNGRRRRGRRGGRRGRATTVEEATRDDSEVFEYVVKTPEAEAKVDPLEGLPPIDEPISYEHMVMMSPELTGDVGEDSDLVEASDKGEGDAAAEEETSGRKRRRRRTTKKDEEAPPEAEAAPEAEEPTAEAEAAEEPEVEEPSAGRRRRRVRRKSAAAEAEETAAPEAEAAPEADAEEKPKRRRRTTKKKDEEEAAATPEPAAEEEEKPKRRRRTTKKKDEEAEATPEADAEEKPKRRRRTTKKKDEEEAAATPEPAAEEEEKPKRRRRTTKKKDEEAEATPEADAEEKPKRRRRTTKKKDEEEAAATPEPAAEEEEKPKRRRRTTKKKDEEAEATPEADAEEKPKRRRRTTKKKDEEEAAAAATAEA